MAVLVRYDTGATMTYHLTAYAPWEGYRLMMNGSRGRPYWSPPRPVELNGIGDGTTGGGDPAREAHGGGDERMTAMLFSGNTSMADPLGRRATEVDGAWALLTGLAANASARERRPVAVGELVDPTLLSEAKQ